MKLETIKKEWRLCGDLYGSELFILMLKQAFKSVAYTNKSIPGGGSPVKDAKFVNDRLTIKKVIFHRNNEVTIITEHGNLRFF